MCASVEVTFVPVCTSLFCIRFWYWWVVLSIMRPWPDTVLVKRFPRKSHWASDQLLFANSWFQWHLKQNKFSVPAYEYVKLELAALLICFSRHRAWAGVPIKLYPESLTICKWLLQVTCVLSAPRWLKMVGTFGALWMLEILSRFLRIMGRGLCQSCLCSEPAHSLKAFGAVIT